MAVTWNTKDGPRRVRHEPPTLVEAIAAAEGLTEDRAAQVVIAAELMGTSVEAVRAEMRKLGAERRSQLVLASAAPGRGASGAGLRTVVVERKASRRLLGKPSPLPGARSVMSER